MPWRPELTRSLPKSRGGAPRGAASARSEEVVAFEAEYPGASWLSTQLLRELEVVGAMAESAIASVARRYGLSHAALNALAVIEGSGGPLPVGAVSSAMHITSGTMTSVLDTLEGNGYIVRLRDPDDRRRVMVDVTPQAQEILNGLLPEVVQLATVLALDFTSEELDTFRALLSRFRAAIQMAPTQIDPPSPRNVPDILKRTVTETT